MAENPQMATPAPSLHSHILNSDATMVDSSVGLGTIIVRNLISEKMLDGDWFD